MSTSYFARLAPFIQDYIYRRGWEALRPVQEQACRVLLDSGDHLLITSGTASGKTEAAFFPALTLLEQEPSATVGMLYVGPLKALINDQFERISELMQESPLPVWHWHGDVSQAEKNRLLRHPSGILQITPESLEGLLMNRPGAISPLFGDLRFVLIDEVHAFMGQDRGAQLLCELNRLERLAQVSPRRIGLSATIRDEDAAARWLAGGTRRQVAVARDAGLTKMRLAIDHFPFYEAKDEEHAEAREVTRREYLQTIYDATHTRKSIIFTNTRSSAEDLTREMRAIAAARSDQDVFYIHHGSISSILREEAELALREGEGPAVACATLTLELGIDLGALQRIVQVGSPYSCSSFVQRLGRSGRRGQPAEMFFVCPEEIDEKRPVPSRIPWMFLRGIAVVELYLKERFIEPFTEKRQPLSLLYQQSMSLLKSLGETTAENLTAQALSLPPFSQVDAQEYQSLLTYWTAIGHIQRMDEGTLILGSKAERLVGNYRFLASFQGEEDYRVFYGSQELGSVPTVPPPGFALTIAGRSWRVSQVDKKARLMFVDPMYGQSDTLWVGVGGDVHTRVMQKMRQILQDEEIYPYLRPRAVARLEEARRLARESGLTERSVLPAGGTSCYILPWVGGKAFRTLERELRYALKEELGVARVTPTEPSYLTVTARASVQDVEAALRTVHLRGIDPLTLVAEKEAPQLEKFDEYIPAPLLRRAFAADQLDMGAHIE